MAVTVDLNKLLDKEYQNKNLDEILKAPVSALAGVTDVDAKLREEAFNIKAVGDLGRNTFFRVASALYDLASMA